MFSLYGNISVVDIHDEICQEISQFSLPKKLTNFFEGGVYLCAMSAGDGHNLWFSAWHCAPKVQKRAKKEFGKYIRSACSSAHKLGNHLPWIARQLQYLNQTTKQPRAKEFKSTLCLQVEEKNKLPSLEATLVRNSADWLTRRLDSVECRATCMAKNDVWIKSTFQLAQLQSKSVQGCKKRVWKVY